MKDKDIQIIRGLDEIDNIDFHNLDYFEYNTGKAIEYLVRFFTFRLQEVDIVLNYSCKKEVKDRWTENKWVEIDLQFVVAGSEKPFSPKNFRDDVEDSYIRLGKGDIDEQKSDKIKEILRQAFRMRLSPPKETAKEM